MFQCSLCGACLDFCHDAHNPNIDFANGRWMDNVNVFEALRADLVESGFALEGHNEMNTAMVELLNPYQRDNNEKEDWMKALDFHVKDASEEEAEVLYYVGCTAALTPKIRNVAVATAKLLHKLEVDFSVFGKNEVCCGSVAMRTGDLNAFKEVADRNTELFKMHNIKTIITSCAGCYRTLKKNYEDRLEGIEIYHSSEFINNLLDEKGIKPQFSEKKVTYHDPCHLGRHMGFYEPPRDLLSKLAKLTEMETTRNAAMCCGAGGGVKRGFPQLSLEMAKNRIKEAEETDSELIVSTCPFCFRNLSDAIEDLDSNLQMVDLVELLLEAL